MAKKETISNVLESGSRNERETKYEGTIVEVVNGDFQATFPKDFEPAALSRQKSFERKMSNLFHYGTYQGKSAVFKENSTAKELAGMSENRQDCRVHWAMYLEAIKAPKHLQKYVFENLKIWMKEHDMRSLNKNFTFDTVAIMPDAWKKGWENVNLFGWCTEFQLDDLLPAAGCEIGKKVIVPLTQKEKVEGEIIGYSYRGENVSGWSGHRYGRIVIWYDVKYGEARYEHAEWKLEAIRFPTSVYL